MSCHCLLMAEYLNFLSLWHQDDAISCLFHLLQYNLIRDIGLKTVSPICAVSSSVHTYPVANTLHATPLGLSSPSVRCSVQNCVILGYCGASNINFVKGQLIDRICKGQQSGPIGHSEISAGSFNYSLRNNAGQRSSQLLRSGSPKSRISCEVCNKLFVSVLRVITEHEQKPASR